jgi:hypothetical protein
VAVHINKFPNQALFESPIFSPMAPLLSYRSVRIIHSSSLISIMYSPSFNVNIDGSLAIAIYDGDSSLSTISSIYCLQKGYHHRQTKTIQCAVSVNTSSGQFLCLLHLGVGGKQLPCDIVLGCDWFNFCSTAIPGATISLSDSTILDFSLSPRVGFRSQSGEYFYQSHPFYYAHL